MIFITSKGKYAKKGFYFGYCLSKLNFRMAVGTIVDTIAGKDEYLHQVQMQQLRELKMEHHLHSQHVSRVINAFSNFVQKNSHSKTVIRYIYVRTWYELEHSYIYIGNTRANKKIEFETNEKKSKRNVPFGFIDEL